MSDYEILSAFIAFTNTLWMIFATYVSIVFAFIVAAYIVADRLTPKVVSLVITLYSLVSLWSVWAIGQNAGAVAATVNEMKRRVAEGNSTLGWVHQVSVPDYMLPIIPKVITSVAFVAYAGSIVFFFYQRKLTRPMSPSE